MTNAERGGPIPPRILASNFALNSEEQRDLTTKRFHNRKCIECGADVDEMGREFCELCRGEFPKTLYDDGFGHRVVQMIPACLSGVFRALRYDKPGWYADASSSERAKELIQKHSRQCGARNDGFEPRPAT